MRKTISRLAALGLVTCMAVGSLSGCSSVFKEDATKYPLVNRLTTQELIDYYATALSYDSIVSRDVVVHEANYETYEVTGSKAEALTSLTHEAETILGNMEYEYSESTAKVVSEDTFNYIKAFLNDKKLDSGSIESIEGALGYYFVTVSYPMSTRSTGTFTQKTNYLGIHGVFTQDAYGNDSLDQAFLLRAVEKLNEYYTENRLNRSVSLDETTGSLVFADEAVNAVGYQAPGDDTEDETVDTTEPLDTATEPETDEEGNIINQEGEGEYLPDDELESNPMQYESLVVEQRTPAFNVELFNKVVGSSTSHSAYMPQLREVFNIPENEGLIGGIGINSIGDNGLKTFNFDRDSVVGTVKLVYVFKDTIDGSGEIIGTNIYPSDLVVTTGITATSNDVVIPNFLMEEFEKLLERADRAIVNCDLPALMSGNIFENIGYGVLRGYESTSVNLLKHMSTIRGVLNRSSDANEYLLEVETVRQEGAKDVDCYGTYREKALVTVRQDGDKFLITDWLVTLRQTQKEPEINPDSAVEKRIVALGLSGEVADEDKAEIKQLLEDLYFAGTSRKLNGPFEVNGVTYERGMYDCFNSDVTMLSSDEKEYINSALRNKLLKYGTSVGATHTGMVTSWIGGTNNQVELITEELITYQGRSDATYMRVYYLVSCMSDVWVIDELTVIEEDTVEGAELDTIASRIQ